MPLRINLHLGVFSLPFWDDVQHTGWLTGNVITAMTSTESLDQEVVQGRFSALKGGRSLLQNAHLNLELRIFRIKTKNMNKVPTPSLSAWWHSFDKNSLFQCTLMNCCSEAVSKTASCVTWSRLFTNSLCFSSCPLPCDEHQGGRKLCYNVSLQPLSVDFLSMGIS